MASELSKISVFKLATMVSESVIFTLNAGVLDFVERLSKHGEAFSWINSTTFYEKDKLFVHLTHILTFYPALIFVVANTISNELLGFNKISVFAYGD